MFEDRYDAANQLAESLKNYQDNPDVVIVAIPRGALEIGQVLAYRLHAPLDIVLTKKIGAPGQKELAIGAVSLSTRILNLPFPVDGSYIAEETKRLRELLKKRYEHYYQGLQPIDLKNKIVILTDDGVATGQTLFAALELIKQQEPKKVIVTIPVGPRETVDEIKKKADEVVCLLMPETFWAIGTFYKNFPQVEDERAIEILHESREKYPGV